MGSLAHFNIAGIRALHGLHALVETGTATGDGVAAALNAGFEAVHSVEIVPELAAAARARFVHDKRAQIWEGDSRAILPMILRDLPARPCLWWLDAHFPGAHTGADYAAETDAGRRLPLEDEVQLIARERAGCRDVLLIDDARIYQPGPYGAGDLPADWPPLAGVRRSLDWLRELYGGTHGIVTDYADQGYVMVFPRVMKKAA
jgi:hypothetical protein